MSRMFLSLFGIETDQDVRRTAIAAVKAGYAVIPVTPGGKIPVCTLNTRELRDQGRDHQCGVHHFITDPKVADTVFARLAKTNERYNIGVVAGPSGLIVVDADTAESVNAFRRLWAYHERDERYLTYTPTVLTPGLTNDEGEWRHKDGGHFYFAAPAGVTMDWAMKGSMTQDGYDIKWGMSQTLVPPSVRPEGPYQPTGDVLEAPAWLLSMINECVVSYTRKRVERAKHVAIDGVVAWSVETPWLTLLSAHGWTDSGKLDGCGCAIWTKPGGGTTSYKSATAHESECDKYSMLEGHGPLHLWTTEPPAELVPLVEAGQVTITKLQFLAAMECGGDIRAAIAKVEGVPDWLDSMEESQEKSQTNPTVTVEESDEGYPSPIGTPGDSGFVVEESPEEIPPFWVDEDAGLESEIQAKAKELYVRERGAEYLAHRRGLNGPSMLVSTPVLTEDTTAVVPEVVQRVDGIHLLYRGRVNTIFGPSEAGKSWFTMACLHSAVRSGGRVLVIDMEDDDGGFKSRLITMGVTQEESDRVTYVRPWGAVTAAERATISAAARGVSLIIIDSLDAYMALQGQDSNHAVSVRAAGAWMKSLAHSTKAAVLLVDHSSEKTEGLATTAMGSSAKKQFIDGALFRADRITLWRPGVMCRTMVMSGKDRHGWAKAHALFKTDSADWGRIVELRMTPDIADDGSWVSNLELRVPPSWDAESGAVESDLQILEDRIIDFLRSKAGTWQTRTLVYGAAGDKNGRGMEPEALARVIKLGIIEHREVPTRGEKVINEYRYIDDEF